ncbi:hypothetical protein [Janthinobacterium lividum]|uniref:hypothetical protein n=1 Tax=Janthinobacterium lividum TaxID=29581 RepID=UPI000FE1CEAA|nr:hypothetical protein [Janthinobacterium lividum]
MVVMDDAGEIRKKKGIPEQLIQKLLQRINASEKRVTAGRVTYVIGNNGTGKSRILANLAYRLESKKIQESSHAYPIQFMINSDT